MTSIRSNHAHTYSLRKTFHNGVQPFVLFTFRFRCHHQDRVIGEHDLQRMSAISVAVSPASLTVFITGKGGKSVQRAIIELPAWHTYSNV